MSLSNYLILFINELACMEYADIVNREISNNGG